MDCWLLWFPLYKHTRTVRRSHACGTRDDGSDACAVRAIKSARMHSSAGSDQEYGN